MGPFILNISFKIDINLSLFVGFFRTERTCPSGLVIRSRIKWSINKILVLKMKNARVKADIKMNKSTDFLFGLEKQIPAKIDIGKNICILVLARELNAELAPNPFCIKILIPK